MPPVAATSVLPSAVRGEVTAAGLRGGRTIARAFALMCALVAGVCSACSPPFTLFTGSGTPGAPCPATPTSAGGSVSATSLLAAAQQAVDCERSFELTVQGHDYVLPQWGGVDGGMVLVTQDGEVLATLTRTGDGLYTMYLVNSQTYFERSTCSHWLRVPGGGSTVLRPFLWSTTSPLSSASQPSIVSETSAVAVVSATIAALGAGTATIWITRATDLPTKMTWTASASAGSGATTAWSFSGWGTGIEVSEQLGSPSDDGPGGNPC
ncbi:MAG: hypothetical protein ABR950_05805 [Candidatus Dormibacteria bacterium]